MRYFFSTGEASGELCATVLARAIAARDGGAAFEGIGAERMRQAGFDLWRDHSGWASMGPLAAIPRIPKLLATMYATALHLRREPPELVVLVDFGAFNVRLAKTLRRMNYRRPILYFLPPAAWLDNAEMARQIARLAMPLTAFAHQRDFYASLGLPVEYFGHPLAAEVSPREPLPAPPPDGGTVAILPGSRAGELRYHVPALLAAYALLRERRPQLRAVVGAADETLDATLRAQIARAGLPEVEVRRGTRSAIEDADAAWVASGTAVLETALYGVPAVALYIIAPALVRHAHRVYRGRYITLPNLVLGREIVPELLQEAATPHNLAQAMEETLRAPLRAGGELHVLRAALGPPDALERAAALAVDLAKSA